METDIEMFLKTATTLSNAGSGSVGPCEETTSQWLTSRNISTEIITFFKITSPKAEIWAGAGSIFAEKSIIRWNQDFPEAVNVNLLLFGSAPNGDFIALDLLSGEVGYICHEEEWTQNPRKFFVPVSTSLGKFIRDINAEDSCIPDDYWEATTQ